MKVFTAATRFRARVDGLSLTTPVAGPASRAAGRIETDPQEWLPGPVPMHGVHEFDCYLRLAGRPLLARVTVGESWVRGGTVSRRVELRFSNAAVRGLIDSIEGDLFVEPRGGGAALSFRGRCRPAGAVGRLGVAGLLSRRLVTAMLRAVARVLGS